ncbi:MAG: hypothetical protein ACODAU_06020 [Myxococcota bacterium]
MDAGRDGEADARVRADGGTDGGVDVDADAGRDAGLDGGMDAAMDAGADASSDAGMDGGPDGGMDAAMEDAGADASSDAEMDGGPDGGMAVPHRAFLTSTTGTGDLGSWAGADGRAGLEAADRICQTLATDAGWSGTFVAWMSDGTDDAYCRIHGRDGKRESNCGQETLPEGAGPWLLADGAPFASAIDPDRQGLAIVYHPPRVDETGTKVASDFLELGYWSGTDDDGTALADTCDDWMSGTEPDRGRSGKKNRTSLFAPIGSTCDDEDHLLCMQVGMGPGVDLPSVPGRRVFVTSVAGPPDLSMWAEAEGATGVAAGDAICQTLAEEAGLVGATGYRAWLSDDTTSASERIAAVGPWVRGDGLLVAESLPEALEAGALRTSIAVDENGDHVPNSQVWTGTDEDGTTTPDQHCGGWTDSVDVPMAGDPEGATGSTAEAGRGWTSSRTSLCGYAARLHCFDDSP